MWLGKLFNIVFDKAYYSSFLWRQTSVVPGDEMKAMSVLEQKTQKYKYKFRTMYNMKYSLHFNFAGFKSGNFAAFELRGFLTTNTVQLYCYTNSRVQIFAI